MIRGTLGLRPTPEDPQGSTPIFLCSRCMGEMYSGEHLFTWEGSRVCTDCFKAEVTAWMNETPAETAFALGVETRTL